eukprot:2628227-Pleurochrysis_carterae.AAC.2
MSAVVFPNRYPARLQFRDELEQCGAPRAVGGEGLEAPRRMAASACDGMDAADAVWMLPCIVLTDKSEQ